LDSTPKDAISEVNRERSDSVLMEALTLINISSPMLAESDSGAACMAPCDPVSLHEHRKTLESVISEVKYKLTMGSTGSSTACVCREVEYQNLLSYVLDAMSAYASNEVAASGSSVYLAGRPGLGKTMVKNAVLERLALSASCPYIACSVVGKSFPTDYRSLVELLFSDECHNELYAELGEVDEVVAREWILNNRVSPSGSSKRRNKGSKLSSVVKLLVIDEVDLITNKRLVTEILQASCRENSKIIVIGLGNAPVTTYLFSKSVIFEPYTESQFERILRAYVEPLFHDRVYTMLSKTIMSNTGKLTLNNLIYVS
jgi:Cdc6-like AAA superfamily ATPase